MVDSHSKTVFPLEEAYLFASEMGLSEEVNRIREETSRKRLKLTSPELAKVGSSIRRGLIAALFEQKEIFQEFLNRYWQNGYVAVGEGKFRRCKRLAREYHSLANPQALSLTKNDKICSTNQPSVTDQFPAKVEFESPKSQQSMREFSEESHLRDFLASNLDVVEPGLGLYHEQGISGVEFHVPHGFIDILAVDEKGSPVVIELKVSRGADKTVGQLRRYMGWVNENLGLGKPRGIIVAGQVTENLRLACQGIPDIIVYEYEVSTILRQVYPSSN